jgi:hypothetical protein
VSQTQRAAAPLTILTLITEIQIVCDVLDIYLTFMGPRILKHNRLIHASGRTKQVSLIPEAACTVFELLMMSGKTARNMYSTDNNKEYCITLHLVGCG